MRTDGEPKYTLYTHDWRIARQRIRGLEDAEEQAACTRLFDHLEEGWKILRPVQVALETDPADGISIFAEGEVTDRFRWIVGTCYPMIPPFGPQEPTASLHYEMEVIGRHLRLLKMAESSPEFPDALRGAVGPASEAFDAWQARVEEHAAALVAMVDAAGLFC